MSVGEKLISEGLNKFHRGEGWKKIEKLTSLGGGGRLFDIPEYYYY